MRAGMAQKLELGRAQCHLHTPGEKSPGIITEASWIPALLILRIINIYFFLLRGCGAVGEVNQQLRKKAGGATKGFGEQRVEMGQNH